MLCSTRVRRPRYVSEKFLAIFGVVVSQKLEESPGAEELVHIVGDVWRNSDRECRLHRGVLDPSQRNEGYKGVWQNVFMSWKKLEEK